MPQAGKRKRAATLHKRSASEQSYFTGNLGDWADPSITNNNTNISNTDTTSSDSSGVNTPIIQLEPSCPLHPLPTSTGSSSAPPTSNPSYAFDDNFDFDLGKYFDIAPPSPTRNESANFSSGGLTKIRENFELFDPGLLSLLPGGGDHHQQQTPEGEFGVPTVKVNIEGGGPKR